MKLLVHSLPSPPFPLASPSSCLAAHGSTKAEGEGDLARGTGMGVVSRNGACGPSVMLECHRCWAVSARKEQA